MIKHFLAFEKQIADLEGKIEELRHLSSSSDINIAEEMNLDVHEEDIAKADLIASDELFFTGTATEVVGVVSVDDNDISDGKPGDITKKIRSEYMNIVLGKNQDYIHWLTKVH